MICLTGDLHHRSLDTGSQRQCDLTEIQIARRYLAMLEEARVKVTFFISGKAFDEEWDNLKPICDHPLVEVGGHTYYCFEPSLWHRAWKKINGSYNGPAWYQRWDVLKTMRIIEARCGQRIVSWRNHMYMHGPFTESVLASCGLEICSDGVSRHSSGPAPHPSGVFNFPLNVMPDHEHLYHAERTPEWVARWVRRYNWSDDYGSDSYYIEEWTERVLAELNDHEEGGLLSNMIVHPIVMHLCDRFKSFERLLAYISTRETIHVRDARRGSSAQREGEEVSP